MLIVDESVTRVQQVINRSFDSGELRTGFRAALDVLRRIPEGRAVRFGTFLHDQDAERYLTACIHALDAHVQRTTANGYSVYRWLWYLRRCPERIYTGVEQSDPSDAVRWNTLGYGWALTEVLATINAPDPADKVCDTGTSNVPVHETVLTTEFALTFPIDDAVARRVVRHCASSMVLAALHVARRWTAKGAAIRFEQSPLPKIAADANLRRAVKIYDERIAQRGTWPDRLGVLPDLTFRDEAAPVLLFLTGIRGKHQLPILLPAELEAQTKQLTVEGRFVPHVVQQTTLIQLMTEQVLADEALWHEDVPMLLALHTAAVSIYRRARLARASFLRLGYAVFPRKYLLDEFGSMWDDLILELGTYFPLFAERFPTTMASLLDGLLAMKGKTWPLLAGPIAFHAGGDRIGINLSAATYRLLAVLEFPVVRGQQEGDAARLRGRVFEDAMQAAVDQTNWRPPSHDLVGRPLRLGGNDIGDIDALAVSGSTWILISCKSQVYTARYDAGDFNIVRNVAQRIERFVTEWDAFLTKLRENPVGDNYDFRGIHLLGVVVTPGAMFVRAPTLDRETLPELRTYSSAGELIRWLKANSIPPVVAG